MNKRGELGDILKDNAIFLILVVFFVIGIGLFLLQQKSGAVVWEDYYVKEIVKAVDIAEAGDEICLDVHKATEIALSNEVSLSEAFSVDNSKNEACVRLSKGRRSCFLFFNDVDVVMDSESLKLAGGVNERGEDVNVLCFNVANRGAG